MAEPPNVGFLGGTLPWAPNRFIPFLIAHELAKSATYLQPPMQAKCHVSYSILGNLG